MGKILRNFVTGEVVGRAAPRNIGSVHSGYYQDGITVKRKKRDIKPNATCTSSFCGHKQYVSVRAADRRCRTLCERCGASLEIDLS